MITVQLFENGTDNMVADFSHDINVSGATVTYGTGKHGFSYCHISPFRVSGIEAVRRVAEYPIMRLDISGESGNRLWSGLTGKAGAVYNGANSSLTITAYGIWLVLNGKLHSGDWADYGYTNFQYRTVDDDATDAHEQFMMDTNNRLYWGLRKNETYAANVSAGFKRIFPSGGDEFKTLNYGYINTVSFDYEHNLPSGWTVRLRSLYSSTATTYFTSTGTGSTITGSTTQTININDYVYFEVKNASGSGYTFTGDTGGTYVKISNLKMVQNPGGIPVSPVDIADSLINRFYTSSGINWSDLHIASDTTELGDISFSDVGVGDAIDSVLSQSGKVASVLPDGYIAIYERGNHPQSRDYYVDDFTLDIERDYTEAYNRVYVVYSGDDTARTDVVENGLLTLVHGTSKTKKIDVRTTSQTVAESVRDAELGKAANLPVSAKISFLRAFSSSGVPIDIKTIKSGDFVNLRGLSPHGGDTLESLLRLRVSSSEISATNRAVSVSVETEIPSDIISVLENE